MKEITIRRKAIEILTEKGFVSWYPPRVRWRKEGDIFGVFDLLTVNKKSGQILFIQLTTLSNVRAREKKIKAKGLPIYSEVWGYDKKNKIFKVISIYGQTKSS